MNALQEFRATALHVAEFDAFLKTGTGQALQAALKERRRQMAKESVSESRALGRHDVFMEVDELFSLAISPIQQRHVPVSEKGGAQIKPHVAALP